MTEFSFSVSDLSAVIQPRRQAGTNAGRLNSIMPLDQAEEGSLTFVTKRQYYDLLADSEATAVLVPEDCLLEPREGQVFLYCENPSLALTKFCRDLETRLKVLPEAGIHPSAVVAEGARIDPTAVIGPGCVIAEGAVVEAGVHLVARVYLGRHTRVGAQSLLQPGVTVLDDCILGRQVICHSGVVIGADGFGYEATPQGPLKIPQIGRVEIGDQVEIGANSTIDRARFASTRIGALTKIDNLVQIGHNVIIGKACILCAQVGIAGSTVIEDGVIIGGQAGIVGHITIGKGAKIGAQAGIRENLAAGHTMLGMPAHPQMLALRIFSLQKQLPDLFKRFADLEKQIQESLV